MPERPGPQPPDDDITAEARRRSTRWVGAPGNPRSVPARPRTSVDAEIARSKAERRALVEMMDASGQADALVVPELEAIGTDRGWCTSITWVEGRISILERADLVVLFGLPQGLEHHPVATTARWDVVARICGAGCWQVVEGLGFERVVTRRWPDADERAAIIALAVDAPGSPG
jgi:hypothetical protein